MLKKLLLLSFTLIATPSYTIDSLIKKEMKNKVDSFFDVFFISSGEDIAMFEKQINNEIDRFSTFIALLATNSKMDTYIDGAADVAKQFITLPTEKKQKLALLIEEYRERLKHEIIKRIKEEVSPKNFNDRTDWYEDFANSFVNAMFQVEASCHRRVFPSEKIPSYME